MSDIDIIVNLADESITDLANSVWVGGAVTDADLDNEDVILYANAHGKSLANVVEFVRKVAAMLTMDEAVADIDDPLDPDQALEAEQEYKHTLPDEVAALIEEARMIL